jgi:hypothetical protein
MTALRFTALVAANPIVSAVAALSVLFAFGFVVAVCVAAPSRRGRRRASRLKRRQVGHRPDAGDVDFDRLLQHVARPSNRGRFGGRP